MKKVNLLLPLVFCVNILAGAAATIKITVDQPSDYTIYVSHIENFFTDEEVGYQINLNNNVGEFNLNLAHPKIVKMRYGSQEFRILVSPNDQQQVNFSAYDPLGTLRFSASGAAANRLLKNIDQQFIENSPNRIVTQEYLPAFMDETVVNQANNSEATYMAWVADRKRRKTTALNQSGLGGKTLAFMGDLIKYEAESEKLFYYLVNKYAVNVDDIERARSQYGLLTGGNLNYTSGLNNPAYVKYLALYIQHINQTTKQHAQGVEFTFYDIIQGKLKGQVRAFMATKLFYNTFRFGQIDLAQTKYANFKNNNDNYPAYIKLLDDLFGDQLQFAEEGEAPNFTLTDMDGRQVSLTDFRGKVVYLSFWATWCKPCLAGFEKSQAIRKQLEDAGVVLINISIDKKDDVWRRTMERIPMAGVNLHAPDDIIKRTYGLSSLPVYHIIDKNGRYAYLPEDGMRDVVEEFEKLIKR